MEVMDIKIPYEKQMDVISEVASPLVVISELIKNAFDEFAKEITVEIDTKNNVIEVTDNGNGFTESSIKSLSKPGESYKKRNNKVLNEHNKVFAGSMGIGLLSIFSIAKNFKILSKGKDGEFIIYGYRDKIKYEKSEKITDKGTKISLNNVNESDIKVLVEDINQDKMKHVSLSNYKSEYNLFSLDVKVDGVSQNLDSPSIEDLYNRDVAKFTSKVQFKYNKDKRELTYNFIRKHETIINSKPVVIKLNKDVSITDILKEHYNIKKTHKSEKFIFLPYEAGTVCDFEGVFYIRETQKGHQEIKKFGPAIRMYINGFGLYNYLEREKDWLNLSYLTANVKNSGMKPNNTIGYISFNHFIETEEELEISKERSHFYDKTPYRALYEMVYKIVTLLTFNIDVAARNNWSTYFFDEYLQQYDQNKDNEPEGKGTQRKGEGEKGAGGKGIQGTGEDGNRAGRKGTQETGDGSEGAREKGTQGMGEEEKGAGGKGTEGEGSNKGGAKSGGPTPGGDSPGTFFEYINWDGKLNPDNNDHVGLIVALDELHKMSNKKVKQVEPYDKAYNIFPVSAGMLLRTTYEQALILQLKKSSEWNNLMQQYTFPMLSNIETHVKQNIIKVLPDQQMRKAFNNITSIKSRDFLNSNIHNPGLIRTTPSTLEGLSNGGMYSLINLIISNL
ncbi:ATP-binding protein [Virgibacillus sp. MSP4-1]|uniref:ATP-binding protein n=1 Tax=Virgibacillus sp. MSP4-1 TaxID=2700081 RepID=UPI00039A649D|nr:ATP-binding protein [Virgibacillus sp. MSP4-1]QHS23461.1 ATP-binding protein [Virgibacillus sp. MSP4-1]